MNELLLVLKLYAIYQLQCSFDNARIILYASTITYFILLVEIEFER